MQLADTADQDSDKQKTSDMARVEFAHLSSILFVDSDEFIYCPPNQSSSSPMRADAPSAALAPTLPSNHVKTRTTAAATGGGAIGTNGGDGVRAMRLALQGVLDRAATDTVQELRFPRVAFSAKRAPVVGEEVLRCTSSSYTTCPCAVTDPSTVDLSNLLVRV